jgi:hypothetical protein
MSKFGPVLSATIDSCLVKFICEYGTLEFRSIDYDANFGYCNVHDIKNINFHFVDTTNAIIITELDGTEHTIPVYTKNEREFKDIVSIKDNLYKVDRPIYHEEGNLVGVTKEIWSDIKFDEYSLQSGLTEEEIDENDSIWDCVKPVGYGNVISYEKQMDYAVILYCKNATIEITINDYISRLTLYFQLKDLTDVASYRKDKKSDQIFLVNRDGDEFCIGVNTDIYAVDVRIVDVKN